MFSARLQKLEIAFYTWVRRVQRKDKRDDNLLIDKIYNFLIFYNVWSFNEYFENLIYTTIPLKLEQKLFKIYFSDFLNEQFPLFFKSITNYTLLQNLIIFLKPCV